MRKIYIDSDFKCHTANDAAMLEIQTDLKKVGVVT